MATFNLDEAKAITAEKEKQYDLPAGTLFKIGGIESSFDGNAVSPKGAKSYFQFMEPTAKAYGVTYGDFNSEADGAARYMRDNLKKYNGNMNMALADYNGGPKAAMALAKGKPYAETADYLSKFHGKPFAPLDPQFTSGTSTGKGYGPSAAGLAREAALNDEQNGGFFNGVANLPGAVVTGMQLDNSVYNFWKQQAVNSEAVDFNYQRSDEYTKQYLDGIPQEHWQYMLQGMSAKQDQLLRQRTLESLQKEKDLAKAGWAGVAGRLAGGLIDLPTLVAFVPGAGGEGMLTATSRISNAIRMGLVGGASNAAIEKLTAGNRPTSTVDDVYMAAAMGLGLGAVAGGAASLGKIAQARLAAENKALQNFGLKESLKAQVSELEGLGMTLSDHGKEIFGRMEQRASKASADVASTIERQAELIKSKYKIEATPEDFSGLPKSGERGTVGDVISKVREEEATTTYSKRTFLDKGEKKGVVTYASEHLEKLKTDADPMIASLATRLSEQLRDDVPVVTRPNAIRAHYDPTRHEIHISPNEKGWVQLHEIAHAVTANKIAFGLQNPNSAHGALVKELKGIFDDVKKASKGTEFADHKSNYYLKNLDEFVAGIYSGKSEFIDFLSKTAVRGEESALTKIVDVIRKILGMQPDDVNALTRALSVTDRLIDDPLRVKGTIKTKSGKATRKDYLMSPVSEAIPEDVAVAAHAAEIPEVFGWGLGLENRLGGVKTPEAVRSLASKLFGTTIGYKDHSVVKTNAWDDTTKMAGAWSNQMNKTAYPAFEDWFKQSGKKMTEKSAAYEEFGTQVSNYVRGMEGEFSPQVIKAGDSVRKTLANVVDYINNPLHDEGGSKKGLTMTEVRDPETGVVTLEGGLDKNPNYLPRKHDVNKWNSLVQTYGRDAVEGWWARAHQAGRVGVSDEQAAKFAKWYVRTVEEAHANRTQDLLDDLIRGQDKEALKHSLMVNGSYSESEAVKIMADMFPTKETDTGATMSSLRHRNTIDEKYSEKWTMPDGSKVDVNINNFVHSNVFDVVNPYLRRTAGSVAMAKHLDVYKNGDIDKLIAGATENKLGSDFKSKGHVDKMRKDLQFAFDRIQGLPQEEFSPLNKAASMWHSFNVIRLMGGAVWNQATEMSQIIGTMGYKATMEAASELKALQRDIATGKAPHDILDHLENTIGGAGSDYISRMEFGAKDDWVRNMGDTKMNQWLDKIDTGMGKVAKGVLDYSGMTPIMIQQKRIHAIALVNHFINEANGKITSSFLTKDRLAWMGLDEAATSRLYDNLKKYTTDAKGEYSSTHKLDVATWVKEDPESHSAFMNAIHRESRRVIQENDLGSMIPLMGTTLGKTVFQFMNFSMHGWNKSLMFAMNHNDWTTLSTVLHGSMLASLAYMGRTMVGAIGQDDVKRQEYLDKRMAPGQIIANSFGRISQASLLPNIYDTLSPYPMFSGMRTTSDLSSLASNPTYQAINGVISLKKLVRNGTSDEYQTTSKDIQTWGKLLPLNNVAPISTLLNSIANDYPHSEKE